MLSETSNRVLVVDDHEVLRAGLKSLAFASLQDKLEWIEAGTLHQALQLYATCPRVDLVLLDLNLPDSHGLNALVRFREVFPAARIAVLSGTADEFVVRQVMALGAVAYIPKSGAASLTLERIRQALSIWPRQSRVVVSPLCNAERKPAPSRPLDEAVAALTPTQLRVLELVLAGMSNQEIANDTRLALGTVKNIVSAIFLIMDVRSRSHLISTFR